MTTRLRRAAVVLAPALLFALAACSDERQDVFTPEGEKAQAINDLQVPVFIVAGLVGVAVFTLLTIAIVRGRRRYKDDGDEPEQIEGNFKREIAWTIAPAVLLAVIAVFTVSTLLQLDDADALPADLENMEITVYGQQWWWSFEYDLDGDGDVEIVTANELAIPEDEDITINITSRDVIHSFWIPALNGASDAVPGRIHTQVLQADEQGEFFGQCKEFCGLSHANMKMRAVSLSMPDFQTWIEQQQQNQPMLAEDDPNFAGQELFIARCTSCHQINGLEDPDGEPIVVAGDADQVSGYAPNLTHLMSRETFAGAMFYLYDPDTGAFNRAQLEAWLRNPPAEKPMYTDIEEGQQYRGMPDLGLTEEEIDRLVDYLMTLGPVAPSPEGPPPSSELAPTDAGLPPTTTDEAGG